MNCLRNSRSVLSRLLPRKTTAVFPPARYYYASRAPRGVLAACASRPPPPQVPSHRRFFTSQWRERSPFLRMITSPPVVIVGGGAFAIYLRNLEAVPFTNRRHFIILPLKLELCIGELVLDVLKEKSEVLPPLHPDSVRVRRIASEIVSSVDRGLADHQRRKRGAMMLGAFPREDDEERRDRGEGPKPQTSSRLLDGWEVIVVRNDEINAECLPGRKILVFTGLLDKFRGDAEIAAVLGHEVAHAIARHGAEKCTKLLMRLILHVVTLQFIYRPGLERALSTAPLFERRLETEADHIGLLLLAAAGYHPRAGPLLYAKMGKIVRDYRSSAAEEDDHPSAIERVRFLSQDGIMNEALELYRRARPCSRSI